MGINRVTVKRGDVNVKALMFALDFAPDAKVGYPAETTGPEQHSDSNNSLAEIAAFAELGTENSPPRRFMSQGADIRAQRGGLMVPALNRLFAGKSSVDSFMNTAGQMLKGAMAAAIKRGNFPPLAASTIAAKGSSEILIDTEQMLNSLDVHVER